MIQGIPYTFGEYNEQFTPQQHTKLFIKEAKKLFQGDNSAKAKEALEGARQAYLYIQDPKERSLLQKKIVKVLVQNDCKDEAENFACEIQDEDIAQEAFECIIKTLPQEITAFGITKRHQNLKNIPIHFTMPAGSKLPVLINLDLLQEIVKTSTTLSHEEDDLKKNAIKKLSEVIVPLFKELITNQAFISELAKTPISSDMLVHYALYLQNLVGHLIGITDKLFFDSHAANLERAFLEMPKEQVLEAIFTKITPEVLLKKVQEMELDDSFRPFLNDPKFLQDEKITEEGALHLLKETGFFKDFFTILRASPILNIFHLIREKE